MKPAVDIASDVSPSSTHDPYQMTVCCLRCEQKLERYQLMRITLAPNAKEPAYAILTCPKCGHVEFVSDSSPLLQKLELISVDAGDGD
jgi:RNase P subunit RPR2